MNDDQTPELEDVLRDVFDAQALQLWTSMPGRVESFAVSAGGMPTVSVQPIPADYLNGEPVALPVLAGVPVTYPQGKGGAITWPLQPGDVVLVVFASRPLDRYRAEGAEGDPQQVRHHDLSDAWAIPLGAGTAAPAGAGTTDAVWTAPTGGKIRLGSKLATESVPLGDALLTWLNTHTHESTTGPTSPPIALAVGATVLSGTVKVTP